MKLIKQIELVFQGGKSDKVYEVDLCEVGPNQYVVNFRYGRRGSALREGTKTALPVAQGKAEQVFDKLVSDKVKKGYLDVQAPAPMPDTPETLAETLQSDDPREQAVLERLRAGDTVTTAKPPKKRGTFSRRRRLRSGSTPSPSNVWSLDRAIWRAGELELRVEPLLLSLISPTHHVRNYSIITALAHCGTEQSVPHLRHVYETAGFPDHIRNLAVAALLMILPEADCERLCGQLLDRLPKPLSDAARHGSSSELESALEAYLAQGKDVDDAVLPVLYLLDQAHTRPVILSWLRKSSLRPPEFKPLRRIFKLAELRRDKEVFGLIAYRFETTTAMFRHNAEDGGARLPGRSRRYLEEDELCRELGSAHARLAFSEKTRQYLRRRVWRTLRRLGDLNSSDYVPIAVDVLLMYRDDDARESRRIWGYQKDRRRYGWINCDAYGAYWTFNHILYHHSPRYMPRSQTWYCRDHYRPGEPESDIREEAFPELWEQAPEQLLRFLRQSHCRPVHAFAVKALSACPEFCHNLDRAVYIEWLGSVYEETAQFGFELVERHFDASQPDIELVFGALVCRYALARERVSTWLQSLSENDAELLVQRLFNYMLNLDKRYAEYAEELATTLLTSADIPLARLDLAIVQQLLDHALLALQQLGGEILLRYQVPVSFALIEQLLNAEHETLRELGVRLPVQRPDTDLARHLELVVVLASHAESAMRAAATPLLRRLKALHGDALTELLILRLINPKLPDGVPSHVLQLLQTEFSSQLVHIGPELVWRLLRAPHAQAQELGGVLLQQNVNPAVLSVKQIVTLADHDVLAVRQAARGLCHQNVLRLKQEMAETVKGRHKIKLSQPT